MGFRTYATTQNRWLQFVACESRALASIRLPANLELASQPYSGSYRPVGRRIDANALVEAAILGLSYGLSVWRQL